MRNNPAASAVLISVSILAIFLLYAGLPQIQAQEYFRKDGTETQSPATPGRLPMFDKDTDYDIYYEVSAYEVHRVENVRIIDVAGINSVPFIVVQYAGYASRFGYIKLTSVQAILPTRAPKPDRSIDMLKQYQ